MVQVNAKMKRRMAEAETDMVEWGAEGATIKEDDGGRSNPEDDDLIQCRTPEKEIKASNSMGTARVVPSPDLFVKSTPDSPRTNSKSNARRFRRECLQNLEETPLQRNQSAFGHACTSETPSVLATKSTTTPLSPCPGRNAIRTRS